MARGPNWASTTVSCTLSIGLLLIPRRQHAPSLNWYKKEYHPIIIPLMLDQDQRRLLGAFIRAHRERAGPGPLEGRRRTPGLRREELAARAGISATWCAWLEQGRAVQASPEALGRLGQALSLTRAERAY